MPATGGYGAHKGEGLLWRIRLCNGESFWICPRNCFSPRPEDHRGSIRKPPFKTLSPAAETLAPMPESIIGLKYSFVIINLRLRKNNTMLMGNSVDLRLNRFSPGHPLHPEQPASRNGLLQIGIDACNRLDSCSFPSKRSNMAYFSGQPLSAPIARSDSLCKI